MRAGENIVELASESAVDAAWKALCEHRKPLLGNPSVLCDREWVEKDAKLNARFYRLFLAMEPPAEVVHLELRR